MARDVKRSLRRNGVPAWPTGSMIVEIHADSVYIIAVEWRGMLVRAAEDRASELVAKLGYKADLCVGSGHPVHFVTSSAAERQVDVLVIGRGLAVRRSSRLPTHAYGIIRESPCPVISLV